MRKIVLVPMLALVLTLPAATPALATGLGATDSGRQSSAADRGGRAESGRKDAGRHSKPKHIRFVEIGTVASVDPAAGTLTVTVRQGTPKLARGSAVAIVVTAATRIRRNGDSATLTELLPGDRVVVEGVRTGAVYTALRVRAHSVTIVDDGPAPTPSLSPTPEPEPTVSVSPTPDPLPSATSTV